MNLKQIVECLENLQKDNRLVWSRTVDLKQETRYKNYYISFNYDYAMERNNTFWPHKSRYILYCINTSNNIVLINTALTENLQNRMLRVVFGYQFLELEEDKLFFELSNRDTITCPTCNGKGRISKK